MHFIFSQITRSNINKTLSTLCSYKCAATVCFNSAPETRYSKSYRCFATYEGRAIADEELIKQSDDWAVEETNFCLGRFPKHTYFPETADMARRTLQLMETQKSRMFTRLRDGTVIPVMAQTIHSIQDTPFSLFNGFECPIVKYTWDETYDDAWEDEEPEFEEGELPFPKTPDHPPKDRAMEEIELIKKATGGN